MKIERINENQIRCTLTKEDLASRQLKISELAYGTAKAKTLFQEMMQQANYEFGFEAEDIPLMIEAIPLNADSIVLIVTKVEDPEELDTRFSRFAPSVMEERDDEDFDSDTASDEMMDLFRQIQETGNRSSQDAEKEDTSESKPLSRAFYMDSLHLIIDAAALTAGNYCGNSILYKDDRNGKYLLVLTQGDADREAFIRTCNIISEYGTPHHITPASLSFLSEHEEALIPADALQKLGNM